MCGRKTLTKSKKSIIEELKISEWDKTINYIPSFNIAPTQKSLVIVGKNNKRQIKSMKWGLIPSWSKNKNIGSKLINARSETLNEKSSFKHLVRSNRCIVLSDGYYEWKNNGNQKIPYFIQLGDGELIYLAGIWRKELKDDKKVRVFSIITRHADSKIKHIHNRMPIILNSNEASEYMDKERSDQIINDKITSDRDIHLKFYEVSKYVNNPQNNDFKCIEPIN